MNTFTPDTNEESTMNEPMTTHTIIYRDTSGNVLLKHNSGCQTDEAIDADIARGIRTIRHEEGPDITVLVEVVELF